MIKFDEERPVVEVRGTSTITWVNREHTCSSRDSFVKLLEENKSRYAFLCGSRELRNDPEMCFIAAKNGVDIETLDTFGVLNENIIVQALKASGQGINNISFGEQLAVLMERWVITPELFGQVIEVCPAGQSFAWEMFRTSTKNKELKDMVINDKECFMYCMSKDPSFFRYGNPVLKNTPEVALCAAKLGINLEAERIDENVIQMVQEELLKEKQEQQNEQVQQVYYGLDGTPFPTVEEAVLYNETLSINKQK